MIIFLSSGSCTANVATRNSFRVKAVTLHDDEWTTRNQRIQTNIGRKKGPKLDNFDFGSKDCNIAVRAKFETSPFKSACRPTLKLEIVRATDGPTAPKQTGEKTRSAYQYCNQSKTENANF